jgi:hypothetical protein
MAYLPDWITVSAFWTTVLIVHGLLSVALLGALTHQAVALLLPLRVGNRTDGFVARFRAVSSVRYANAVCVLWILCFVFGAWLYTKYRIQVRIPIEQDGFFKTQGVFELKEHLVSFGLGLLPLYWSLWAYAVSAASLSARKWITVWLAFICWYAYLVGHVVNNVRGFGS